MSFILDALRKSEHERQRQTGPALVEVAVAPAKPRSNVWATAAIALLLVNLVAVGVFLIRKASQTPVAAAPVAAAPAPQQPPPAAPTAAPAQVTLTQTAPAAQPTPPPAAPPMLQPAGTSERPSPGSRNPLEDEMQAGPPAAEPELVAEASAVPAGPPAVRQAPTKRGSVVYEALPETATLGAQQTTAAPPPAGNAASSDQKLPTADELAGSGGVPTLSLDLHVYSTKPAERMAFINAHKYREGDQLQEGPVVRQITPEGVILEMNGRKFLLSRD
jgi:general secretion pathway protein B